MHCFLVFHLVWVMVSKLFFPEGGWIENSAPFGLIYGPFLYFLTYTYSRGQWPAAKSLLLVVPYGIFLIFQIGLLLSGTDMHSAVAGNYMAILYTAIPISFLVFGIWGWWNLKSWKTHIGFVFYLYLFITLMAMVIVGLNMINGVLQPGGLIVDTALNDHNGYIVYTFFLGLIIILNRYAIRIKTPGVVPPQRYRNPIDPKSDAECGREDNLEIRYEKSGLDLPTLDRYEKLLDNYVFENKPWLDSNISLQTLASALKIPPHHLTQLLNVRKGVSFNQYINKRRIDYACELLKKRRGDEVNFEELAYECGFNSKATFYRWFKNIKFMPPSKFLDSRR